MKWWPLAVLLLLGGGYARAAGNEQNLPGIPAPNSNPNAGLNPNFVPQAPAGLPETAPEPPPTGINPVDSPNPAPSLGLAAPPAPVPPADLNAQCLALMMKAGTAPGTGDPRVEWFKKRAGMLSGDEKFVKAALEIWNSPKRKNMFFMQLGFFIFMILVKTAQQSQMPSWYQKFLVGLVCSLITCVGVSYMIPLFVLGEPFGVFIGTLWKVFFRSG